MTFRLEISAWLHETPFHTAFGHYYSTPHPECAPPLTLGKEKKQTEENGKFSLSSKLDNYIHSAQSLTDYSSSQ